MTTTQQTTQGYWTDGVVDPKTNIRGTGVFVPATASTVAVPAPVVPTPEPRRATTILPPPALPTQPPLTPPNETDIRNTMLNEVQGQVDNIKNTYAGILGEVATANTNRAGKTRSIDARSGLLGSDFGKADISNTDVSNQKILDAKVAERDEKISALINGVNQLASQKYETEANRYSADYDKRLAQLKTNQEAAQKNLGLLGQEGLTIKDFSDEELQNYINTTGLSEKEIEATLALNQKPQNVVQSWAEGSKYYVITKDPLKNTYNTTTVDLPFTLPTKYTSAKVGDNTIAFYPENPDPKTPIENQIKYYTIPGAKPTTKNTPIDNITQKDEYNTLTWLRAQPDYKPEYETQFNSDPVAKAKAIQAYKDSLKKSTARGA